MADIRRRVAEKKARGMYGVDALAASSLDESPPLAVEELERLRDLSVQRVDLATTASTKPVVGPVVAKAKYRLTRAVSQPLFAMAAHASTFNAGLLGYVARLGREAARLREDLDAVREQIRGSSGRAEALAAQLAEAQGRLEEAEARLAALRAEGLHERVSRLEHGGATAERPSGGATPIPAPPDGVLGLMLEARDWREEDAARWAAWLRGIEGPVLHVGCGSGRGLAALGDEGQGVDDDPELVEAARREGRPVTLADPVEYVASLGRRSLGGALVTGMVERMDGARLGALLGALARALREGAPLVVEGLDPSDVGTLAGDVWRDPRRARPLHADAVTTLVEAAGLATERVETLVEPARYAVHAVA